MRNRLAKTISSIETVPRICNRLLFQKRRKEGIWGEEIRERRLHEPKRMCTKYVICRHFTEDAQHLSELGKHEWRPSWESTAFPPSWVCFIFFKEKRKKEMWPHYVPEGFRAIETLIHCKFECKMVQPLWKLLASYRDEHGSLWDPTIPHLEIYLKEMKICVHTETCHLECRAVLLLYLRNSQIILIWINLKNFILEGDVSELTNPRIL